MNLHAIRSLAIICILVAAITTVNGASEYGSKSTNVSIPDNGGWAYSTINISGAPAGATITGIDVYFDINHTYSGDLVVDLEVGTYSNSERLWNREGGSADNPSRTTSTSAFNGLPVNNTWYLYARDYEAGDSGEIDRWTITIYYSSATPPSAPSLTSPGSSSSPGSIETDFTPRFRWSSVSGATGYGLYIRDQTTGQLIYDNDNVSNTTSLTLSSGYMVAGHEYRWNMRAENSSGWSGYSSYRYFQMQGPTPSITNVEDDPATGSNSPQPFTINGSNFVSGCSVFLRDLSTGEDFPNRAISSFSSTRIVINPTFTTDAHNWSVEIINPGGGSSGQYAFSVVSPTVTPSITSVENDPVTGSNSPQAFTINGSNFVSGCNVFLRDLSTGEDFPNRAISSLSSTRIVINPTFTTEAHNWSVEVINPGGGTSGQYSFSVVAPAVTPTITSVEDNPVVGSNSPQPFTINGSSFVSGCNVFLRDLSTGEDFPNRAISSFSSTRIVVNPTFTTDAHNWSVEVINPGGATSGQYAFSVVAPSITPTIASVEDDPVVGSNSPQPFIINGSNFVSGCNVFLRDLSTGEEFPNRATNSFSSTRIVINPIFTKDAHNWSVEIINPGSRTSGQYAFSVVAPTVTPTITSVEDNPVVGSDSQQPFIINGNNFVSGCNVFLRDLSTGEEFPNRAISSFSSTRIVVNPTFTTEAHNWSVKVINPGSLSSGQYPFAVISPNSVGGFYLSFPLRGRTAQTATIISVFDHDLSDDIVVAYTGEQGERQYGVEDDDFAPSFRQASGMPFIINGAYSEGEYLSYDNHHGYDYRTKGVDQDPVNGIVDVLAAAPGLVVESPPSTGAGNYVRIEHTGLGYQTQYLHLSSIGVSLGQTVERGQVIGQSGGSGGVAPHLHFEVKQSITGQWVPVDPYGWSGSGSYPYGQAENRNLWNSASACTYVLSTASRTHGSSAGGGSFDVSVGTGCSWTATTNVPWITITSGNSGSGSGSVVYQVSENLGQNSRVGKVFVEGGEFLVMQNASSTERVYGIDVSSVGQGVVSQAEWNQLPSQGISFAWIRATKGDANSEGNCRFIDPQFLDNADRGNRSGVTIGAYHVANVLESSALDEASFFVSVASDYIGPNYLRPVLDVESHSCGDPASLGVVALSEWIDQWCSEVKRLTGADPIIYCGFSYLSNFEAYLGQKYDLWIARFTENPESQFSIAPWSERTIFQYSQSGALQGITPVDLNVFNGSVAEFRQRLVISEPKVVPSGSLSSGSGTFDLDVSSTGQQQVIIQASDDLENWVDIGAAIMINGEATFSDEEAGNYSARFYRPKP